MRRITGGFIVFLCCGLFFLYWCLATLLPVLFVEIHYQFNHALLTYFKTSDLRGVVLPQFRFIAETNSSKNAQAGITIPSLYLDEPILFNVDPNDQKAYTAALKKGIAHASGTSLPDSGGLGYYFAHSSQAEFVSRYNAVFYLLGKLHKNDLILVWHEGKHYDYSVTNTAVTESSDVTFLHKAYDKETIVLQTCWPPGTTWKRLLVFAERSDIH